MDRRSDSHERPAKRRRHGHEDYTIAWICALPIERAAAEIILDEKHESIAGDRNDNNTYLFGRVGQHNVVIACLPSLYGTNNASSVASDLRRSFPSIRATLMVGIGGAVPSMVNDVRLGDVVVGTSMVQSDLGKIRGHGQLEHTAIPRYPPRLLDTAVSSLRANHELRPSLFLDILDETSRKHPTYRKPDTPDRIFQSTYPHQGEVSDCEGCNETKRLARPERSSERPVVHYGRIASGNQVVKCGQERDRLARELGGAICFEMETAGLMDVLPCLPIRGISDYSDSHKNKEWQRYAAASAAALAKELLGVVNPELANVEKRERKAPDPGESLREAEKNRIARREVLLESLSFDQMGARLADIEPRLARTCQWFLNHAAYKSWLDAPAPSRHDEDQRSLWLRGKAGAGKSTMMKFLYKETRQRFEGQDAVVASFFFHARGSQLEKSVAGLYRTMLCHLLNGFPDLQSVLDDTDIVPERHKGCPSFTSLKALLEKAISALCGRTFVCFVDALDEADEQQVREMVRFFKDLTDDTDGGSQLRICFSSRPYPEIGLRWGTLVTLEDEQGHKDDISQYLKSRLTVTGPLLSVLTVEILKKASGVFMWVVLVAYVLNREHDHGSTEDELRRKLDTLPSMLSDLFRDMLSRDDTNMDRLRAAILWILCAEEPLSPAEFCHAVWSWRLSEPPGLPSTAEPPDGMSPDIERRVVIGASKGLAEITRTKDPRVQFIHESVRDFLLKDQGLRELWPDIGFGWRSSGCHRLRECCAAYLHQAVPENSTFAARSGRSQEGVDEFLELAERYPLLTHATQHVLSYAELAAEAMAEAQRDFLSRFPSASWISAFNHTGDFYRSTSSDMKPLSREVNIVYLLARHNKTRLLKLRLQDFPDIDHREAIYGWLDRAVRMMEASVPQD